VDIVTITNEIKSKSLKEIIKTLGEIVKRVQDGEITYQQGSVEITGCKHIIQSLALDWSFSKGKVQSKPDKKHRRRD